MMIQFNVFYEPHSGDIKGISAGMVATLEKFPSLKIEYEEGLEFIEGKRNTQDYYVTYDPNYIKKLILQKKAAVSPLRIINSFFSEVPKYGGESDFGLIIEISRNHKTAQIYVNTERVEFIEDLLVQQNVMLSFYITKFGDPSFLIDRFNVELFDIIRSENGKLVHIKYPLEEFNLYTKKIVKNNFLKLTSDND